MARHRAPTSRTTSRAAAALTVAGAALGATLWNPGTASAAPASSGSGLTADDVGDIIDVADAGTAVLGADSDEADDPDPSDGDPDEVRTAGQRRAQATHHRAPRPMTSGERQYRTGCRQGYIVDQCERFTVRNLLRNGINPYL